jgi:hypothetical protein
MNFFSMGSKFIEFQINQVLLSPIKIYRDSKYTYFPNAFFVILHKAVVLMLIFYT